MMEPDYGPLEALLAVFSYKPGWEFIIDKNHRSLVIRMIADDADRPGNKCPVHFPTEIPPRLAHCFDWPRWLREQIMAVERHECDEFFQVDGRKLFDPHA